MNKGFDLRTLEKFKVFKKMEIKIKIRSQWCAKAIGSKEGLVTIILSLVGEVGSVQDDLNPLEYGTV